MTTLTEHSHCFEHLLPVLFILDGVDGCTTLPGHRGLKLGILAVPTRVAQEGIALIVVDSSRETAQNIAINETSTRTTCI